MKITKHLFALLAAISASALIFSCASAGNLDDSSASSKSAKSADGSGSNGAKSSSVNLPPPPARLTEAPVFDFSGDSIQVEAEAEQEEQPQDKSRKSRKWFGGKE